MVTTIPICLKKIENNFGLPLKIKYQYQNIFSNFYTSNIFWEIMVCGWPSHSFIINAIRHVVADNIGSH